MTNIKMIYLYDTIEDLKDTKIDDLFNVLNQVRNELEEKQNLSPVFVLCSYGMIIAPVDKTDEVLERMDVEKRGKFG